MPHPACLSAVAAGVQPAFEDAVRVRAGIAALAGALQTVGCPGQLSSQTYRGPMRADSEGLHEPCASHQHPATSPEGKRPAAATGVKRHFFRDCRASGSAADEERRPALAHLPEIGARHAVVLEAAGVTATSLLACSEQPRGGPSSKGGRQHAAVQCGGGAAVRRACPQRVLKCAPAFLCASTWVLEGAEGPVVGFLQSRAAVNLEAEHPELVGAVFRAQQGPVLWLLDVGRRLLQSRGKERISKRSARRRGRFEERAAARTAAGNGQTAQRSRTERAGEPSRLTIAPGMCPG